MVDRTRRDLAYDSLGRRASMWIPASSLLSSAGSPTLSATGGGSRFPVWLLDAAATEQVTAEYLVPDWWTHYDIDLYYTNVGAGSGGVVFEAYRSAVIDGGNLTSGDVLTHQATNTAPAQNVVKVVTLNASPLTNTSTAVQHLRFARSGAAGGDTLANDVDILGFLLRRRAVALKLVADGNSLTVGQGSTGGQDYLQQLKTLLTDTAPKVIADPVLANFGVGGQTTDAMIADAATQIDTTLAAVGTYSAQVLLGWEGTNDLYFGATAQDAYDDLATYYAARKAAGWRVLAFTITPRSNSGTPSDFETKRQQVNALLRANWPAFADGLVDVAADHRIGREGAETDTTYYTDLVHMTNAGYAVVAELASAAVQRLRGGN